MNPSMMQLEGFIFSLLKENRIIRESFPKK
jgi:hypothetical protein